MGGKIDLVGATAFIIAAAFVGGNFVAIRFSNMELDPFWGATIRFIPAALVFYLLMALRKVPFPSLRETAGPAIFGTFGVGAFFAFAYWGLQTATAATGAIILSSVPLFTFLFSWAHRLEPFRSRRLVGALLVIAGIALLATTQPADSPVRGEGTSPLYAVLALVGAAVCLSESAVLLKHQPPVHPFATNAIGFTVGSLILLSLSIVTRETWKIPAETNTWIALVYLMAFGSVVVFFLIVTLIQRWGPSASVYIMVASPLVAVTAGALLADEPVTWALIASGALVVAGVYVGVIMRTKKSEKNAPEKTQSRT